MVFTPANSATHISLTKSKEELEDSHARAHFPYQLPPGHEQFQIRLVHQLGPEQIQLGRQTDVTRPVHVCDSDENILYTAQAQGRSRDSVVHKGTNSSRVELARATGMATTAKSGRNKAIVRLHVGSNKTVEGTMKSIFKKPLLGGLCHNFKINDRKYVWRKATYAHDPMGDGPLYNELIETTTGNRLAHTQRIDLHGRDGEQSDQNQSTFPIYISEEARSLTDLIVATFLLLEQLEA